MPKRSGKRPFYASLGFNFLGETVCSVSLDVVLEGPSPCWHIAGRASITILFATVNVGVDESWGHEDVRPLTAPDVESEVRRALLRPEAWAPLMPDGVAGILRLRVAAAGEDATPRVHPLGALTVRQEVAPLNEPITRFGAVPLSAPTTLKLAATVDSANLGTVAKRDRFAARRHASGPPTGRVTRHGGRHGTLLCRERLRREPEVSRAYGQPHRDRRRR